MSTLLPSSVDILFQSVPALSGKTTLSGKTSTQDGSRVNNPVFHARNCEKLAHTPGKRYAWQPTGCMTGYETDSNE